MSRGGFVMNLMKLKLHGPSLARDPFKGPETGPTNSLETP